MTFYMFQRSAILSLFVLYLELLYLSTCQTYTSQDSCCTTEHYEMYIRSGEKVTKVDQHRCVMRPVRSLNRIAHCCCQATFILESVGYGVEYFFIPEYGCYDVECPRPFST